MSKPRSFRLAPDGHTYRCPGCGKVAGRVHDLDAGDVEEPTWRRCPRCDTRARLFIPGLRMHLQKEDEQAERDAIQHSRTGIRHDGPAPEEPADD